MERKDKESARQLVRGDELPVEVSRQGLIQWYLHPEIRDTVLRTMLFYVQVIPPNSRSGKMRHQGGIANLILEGRGYSIVNGVRHDWEAVNSLFLPILREGVVVQHFNPDPEKSARMAVAMPNVVEALGVDLGAGWEQLEDAPEYAQRNGARG